MRQECEGLGGGREGVAGKLKEEHGHRVDLGRASSRTSTGEPC